ncbi:MAG TPA: hypothetical protein VMV73_04525 [Candidatus Dormibacteraeota bacterium]|nr:hypothetical protein [Candidatus Dormibacteraeota bacterium]
MIARILRRPVFGLVRRIASFTVASALGLVVVAQFARAIEANIQLDTDLHATQADIQALQRRDARLRRSIVRLRDPRGAIPEIHSRLRMLAPNERMIFIEPSSSTRSH